MSDISILGTNIKRIREEKGISAYKLAKDAGVGPSTLSQIETGKRQTLQGDTLEKIATALDIPVNKLFEAEEGISYTATDLEQTIHLILTSDDLTIDDIEITKNEKIQVKMALDIVLNCIRLQRAERRDK